MTTGKAMFFLYCTPAALNQCPSPLQPLRRPFRGPVGRWRAYIPREDVITHAHCCGVGCYGYNTMGVGTEVHSKAKKKCRREWERLKEIDRESVYVCERDRLTGHSSAKLGKLFQSRQREYLVLDWMGLLKRMGNIAYLKTIIVTLYLIKVAQLSLITTH